MHLGDRDKERGDGEERSARMATVQLLLDHMTTLPLRKRLENDIARMNCILPLLADNACVRAAWRQMSVQRFLLRLQIQALL